MKKYYFSHNGQKYLIQEGACIIVHTLGIKTIGDIASPIIRKVTKCYYNHAATVVMYLGELYVVEAEMRGFNPDKKLSDYLDTLGEDREIAILLPQEHYEYTEEYVYESLRKIVNAPYGFWTLCIIQPIYQLTGKWLGHTEEYAEAKPICSQALAFIYRKMCANWWTYSPKDLWKMAGKEFVISFESNTNDRVNFELKNK